MAFRGPQAFLLPGTLPRHNPAPKHPNAQKGGIFQLHSLSYYKASFKFFPVKRHGLGEEALNGEITDQDAELSSAMVSLKSQSRECPRSPHEETSSALQRSSEGELKALIQGSTWSVEWGA